MSCNDNVNSKFSRYCCRRLLWLASRDERMSMKVGNRGRHRYKLQITGVTYISSGSVAITLDAFQPPSTSWHVQVCPNFGANSLHIASKTWHHFFIGLNNTLVRAVEVISPCCRGGRVRWHSVIILLGGSRQLCMRPDCPCSLIEDSGWNHDMGIKGMGKIGKIINPVPRLWKIVVWDSYLIYRVIQDCIFYAY